MTDINQYHHSLQNDIIQEEPQQNSTLLVEEGDITEAVPNIIHIARKPSLSLHTQERLHDQGDSESEEDVTEEHVDTNLLVINLDTVNLNNNDNTTTTSTTPLPQPTVSTSTNSTRSTSAASFHNSNHDNNQQQQVVTEEIEAEEEGSAGHDEQQEEEQLEQHEEQGNNNSNADTLQDYSEENVDHATELISPTTPITAATATATNNSSINSGGRGRSVSSVNPSTTTAVIGLLSRSQRVWEMDRQAPECRRCHRRFNFLVRRHHCRRCGQIVCDKCSSNRIRLPVEELIEDPMVSISQYPLLASQSQRVCDTCYREPIRRSSAESSQLQQRGRSSLSSRSRPYDGTYMRRTDSSQSLMIDCPVCGNTFLGMPKNEQEDHLQRCLNVGSPPVQSPRYIVYELSKESTQIGDECPICFDEFNQGDKISRMICLCSYHQHCLANWLQRGKGCPVHYDSLLQN